MKSVAPSPRSYLSAPCRAGGEREAARRAAIAADRRTRPVGGQIERRRRALELLPPVGEVPLELLAREPLPLPRA